MGSNYYVQVEKNSENAHYLEQISEYADENGKQIFVIDRPLGENKYRYDFLGAFVILCPGYKILFVHYNGDENGFREYVEDFIEDLGTISDKYQYKEVLDRPKKWRKELIFEHTASKEEFNVDHLLKETKVEDATKKRSIDLLISLLTGSINDVKSVGGDAPETLLDAVKRKITLFDSDQSRFIYEDERKRRIFIQGLSGTGKTELLLHKLRDIYVNEADSRIIFTCHNKVLAKHLKSRILQFFNFMKVEEQIEWEKRLWCVNAWGSNSDINSGIYRYLCNFYSVPFYSFSYSMSFKRACKLALETITKQKVEECGTAFDYVLIDESQDFSAEFFDLCDRVTSKKVYIAGDIFQNIFDYQVMSNIEPDFLLSRCYRTDPKTLMFAHAIGMALFEKPKLNWLEDKEWEMCGYNLSKKQNGDSQGKYVLSREPLRRFEDIADQQKESVEIVKSSDVQGDIGSQKIIEIISSIRDEHPTVQAEDIGIIFIDSGEYVYALSELLEEKIDEQFDWPVNIAYRTKSSSSDSVFISNKNNVKGLEFPFVICVTKTLAKSPFHRNTLYAMLSRSFIKTYLLIDERQGVTDLNMLESNLKTIQKNGTMTITPPADDEKRQIKTSIRQIKEKKPLYDIAQDVFKELAVESLFREPLLDIVKKICNGDFDRETVRNVIEFNYNQIGRSNS